MVALIMSFSKLFFAAIDGLSEGIWVIDYRHDRHYWFASARNKIKYGIPTGEAPKDFWIKNLHPDDLKFASEGYQRAAADPAMSSFEHEYRFRAANGNFLIIHDTIKFIRDNDGVLRQAVGTWKDVSSERKLENLLYTFVSQEKSMMPGRVIGSEKLVVPTAEGFTFVDIRTIIYCRASSNYTEFSTIEGSVLIASRTLKDYEQILTKHGFFRIHHSYLINLAFIKKYVRGDGGYVVMQDEQVFDVSKRKRDAFLTSIENHFTSLSTKGQRLSA